MSLQRKKRDHNDVKKAGFFSKTAEKLRKITKTISFSDFLMIAGTIMAGKGIYMIYQPAMWIIIGAFVVYLGWPRRAVE